MQHKLNKKEILLFIKDLLKHPLFYILIVLFIADIVSKWVIASHFNFIAGQSITLIPGFLIIELVYNEGAIGGLGGNLAGRIIFIIIRAIIVFGAPIVYFYKHDNLKKSYKICLGLIYVGAIGNFIDSTFYWKGITPFSGVIDFINHPWFKIGTYNFADAYITIGVFLIIILFIIDEIKEIRIKNRQGAYSLTPEEYEKRLAEQNKKENGYSNKK